MCGSGSPVGIFVYIVNVRASECAGCSVLGDVTPAYLLESEARNGPLHLTYYPLSPTLTYRHHHRHGSSSLEPLLMIFGVKRCAIFASRVA